MNETVKAIRNRERLEQAAGLLGLDSLRHHDRLERNRIEYEDIAAHRAMWKEDPVVDEDEMGDLILGDRITTIQSPLAKYLGPALVAAAIAIPAALAWIFGPTHADEPLPPKSTVSDYTIDTHIVEPE